MQDLVIDVEPSEVREGVEPIDTQWICRTRYIFGFVPDWRSSAVRIFGLLAVLRKSLARIVNHEKATAAR